MSSIERDIGKARRLHHGLIIEVYVACVKDAAPARLEEHAGRAEDMAGVEQLARDLRLFGRAEALALKIEALLDAASGASASRRARSRDA